jgi:cellulose synthase (UDP-forming)
METSKSVADSDRKLSIEFPSTSIFPLRPATLVVLGMLGCFCAIATAWFLEKSSVSEFFARLDFWQTNPPFWIAVPEVSHQYLLFLPAVILFGIVYTIIKLSPQPKVWSRTIVIAILLALTIRYLLWRVLSSLNLSNPLDGIFSLLLLFMEALVIAGGSIQLYLMLGMKDRSREADRYSQAVIEGKYTPSVDILIPTYNEPEFVLRRTIIGCQAIDYADKKVYLLDDTRRPEIKRLARELGCYYFARADNRYAKAGNLNHALTKTQGKLIAVFDADFIPTKNFLSRVVGFFQNEKIALVQTPQTFYNDDPIARNLGIAHIIPSEEDIFYRHVQPIKDGAGSVVCSGTSFMMRRSALQEVGGFVTDSISEDYYTGIRLSAKGYQSVYLNETLSAGLAAESMYAHILQRLRWARGTLQGLFIDSNPFVIPGLRLRQRLAHLEGFITWFSILPRLFFIIIPMAYSFFGIEPLAITFEETIYIFFPYYLLQLTTFAWLNQRSRSIILSDVYAVVSCFPLFVTVVKVMFNPFGQGFKVTPKGLFRAKNQYNWRSALPLIIFFIGTVVSLWITLGITNSLTGNYFNLVVVWEIYNIIIISIALLGLLDITKPDIYEWFAMQQRVQITSGDYPPGSGKADRTIWGTITQLSEIGAEIQLQQPIDLDGRITLEIPEEKLTLFGKLTHINLKNSSIRVKFESLTSQQSRRLIELLFCRPGQWKHRNTPGEWRSLWLLFTILFRPILFLFASFNKDKRKKEKLYN